LEAGWVEASRVTSRGERFTADLEAELEEGVHAIENQDELVSLLELLRISKGSRNRGALTDLALELAQKSAGFRQNLPESLSTSRDDLVRAMNCYVDNLIDGHDIRPVDIERAVKSDYSLRMPTSTNCNSSEGHTTVRK
jgi:hypothetical protein